ncbi:hypothetical protein Pelo_12520 [Pelomyxa schiedti]|nr:hypothetical protein Pelo_12520 [Pelomyxa schiedti]
MRQGFGGEEGKRVANHCFQHPPNKKRVLIILSVLLSVTCLTHGSDVDASPESGPQYGVTLSGYIGSTGENDFTGIQAVINPPYWITSVNPIPLSVPSDTLDAALLVTSITKMVDTYSQMTGTITIYPASNCQTSGYYVLEFFVGCVLEDDPTCDESYSSFNVSLPIYIPSCDSVDQSGVSIRTYDEKGNFDVRLQPGQTIIIDEKITTDLGTPQYDCNCTTELFLYDWSGNLLGHHNVESEAELFHPTSLLVSPLENKLRVFLDPIIFNYTKGEVVKIHTTCDTNWVTGRAQSVSGDSTVTAGVAEEDGADDNEGTDGWIIGLSVGLTLAAAAALGAVGFFVYKKWRRTNPTHVQLLN